MSDTGVGYLCEGLAGVFGPHAQVVHHLLDEHVGGRLTAPGSRRRRRWQLREALGGGWVGRNEEWQVWEGLDVAHTGGSTPSQGTYPTSTRKERGSGRRRGGGARWRERRRRERPKPTIHDTRVCTCASRQRVRSMCGCCWAAASISGNGSTPTHVTACPRPCACTCPMHKRLSRSSNLNARVACSPATARRGRT